MSLSPGTNLGRYRIESLIGQGGMGEVYQARDERLGRHVAIKVLAPQLSEDPDVRARFDREARAAARLSHPNIVAIYDVGEERGIAYAVMELLEGITLRARLRWGPLPPEVAADYASQILDALAAAHAKGIVHRDLKPENVFLPSGGSVKLLDFGIARLQAGDGSPDGEAVTSPGTRAGVVLGTVEYMSPEQVRSGPVDHRSDLFSFGVVLYEMIRGRRPFAGGSVMELAAILETSFVDGPDQVPSGDPRLDRLDEIARRCLQKRPEDRFSTAVEITSALTLPQAAAVAPSDHGRPPRPGASSHAADGSVAVLPFVDLSADRSLEYFCDGVAEEILNELSRLPGLRVAARSSSFQFRGGGKDARQVGAALNVRAVLEGSVRASGNRLRISPRLVDAGSGFQVWSARFDRDLDDIFAVQDEIARAVIHELKVGASATVLQSKLGAGTANLEAYTRYLKGRHHWSRRTEADLEASVAHFEAALELDAEYVDAHAGLAEVYVTLGLYGAREPGTVMPRAKASAAEALARAPARVDAQAALACVEAVHHWDWSGAERSFRNAIGQNPNASQARHWFAINCLAPRGRFAEARRELDLALEVDPLSAALGATVGLTSYLARRFDDAITESARAIARHPDFAIARLFHAHACSAVERYDEAARELDLAARLSPGSPEVLSAQGYVAGRAGDEPAARAVLGALLARSAERYTSPTLVAQVLVGLGDEGEALTWLERARDVRATDLAWLAVRPVWDPLRPADRFRHLLTSLGLSDV